RSPAEVRVLVIEEETLVEPAELLEAVAADQEAPASHPRDSLSVRTRDVPALPARPRQEQPRERVRQGREWAGRRPGGAVRVAEADPDHTGPRLGLGHAVNRRQGLVEEPIRDGHVGVDE